MTGTIQNVSTFQAKFKEIVNPITAVVKALELIKVKRLSLLMPCLHTTAEMMANYVSNAGVVDQVGGQGSLFSKN